MPRKKASRQLIALLKGSVSTLFSNPSVFFPFVIIAFIQLLILECLYFAPRFPLSVFFNPLVKALWGSQFIHYPDNFVILPKLFQYAQVPVYIFISSFFVSVAVAAVAALNGNRKPNFRVACWHVWGQYIHIFVGALLSFFVFYGLYRIYNMLVLTILNSVAREGMYAVIKSVSVNGSVYAHLLIGVLVTALFAFVFPVIVIEKKKIFTALGLNFKYLWGSFWFVFIVVLIPTLFYVPVLLLRSSIGEIAHNSFPEARVMVLAVSILVSMIIDGVVYVALTTYYLLLKESL